MKSNTVRLLLILGLVWFATEPVLADDWRGRGRASGQVRDENDAPIVGATIRIYQGAEDQGPEPVLTNKKGRWVVGGLRGGSWSVVISAEGFKEAEGSYNINEFGINRPLVVNLNAVSEEELIDEAAAQAIRQLDAGNSLLQQGKYQDARAEYASALENLQAEYHPMVLQGIANAHLGEGNAALALETLEKALTMSPDDADLLMTKARAHYDSGDAAASISTLERTVTLAPDNVPAMQLLIDLLVREGRTDEADVYMEKLPEGVKVATDTVLNSGITAYNNGDLDSALKQFNTAVANNPEMADAYYYRGLVHLGKSQNDEATTDLRKFLELAPDDSKASEAEQFLSYLESP